MTVLKVVGSSLDDVWGQDVIKKKKRPTKRNSDPLCDMYSDNPTRFDDIMNVYHPASNETYDKANYSRTQNHLLDTDADDRESDIRELTVGSEKTGKNTTEKFSQNSALLDVIKRHGDKEKQYIDLAMYVFSGIALIFILEQFVSIGIALSNR
jgi:hypothetical protein